MPGPLLTAPDAYPSDVAARVATTRVVLATRPRLLREMMSRLVNKQPGLEVVAEVADLHQLDAVIRAEHPQCVVTTTDEQGGLLPQVRRIQRSFPRIRLLALALDGQTVQIGAGGGRVRFGTLRDLMTLIRGTEA